MVNKVTLVGRLGSDPEVRYTGDGKPVANISLATDESYKNAQGEKVKKAEWHRLVAWDKLAEVAQNYLHKGDMIYIEGKLQSRSYESDKDGQTHTVFEILVRELKMLGTKGEEAPATSTASTVSTKTPPRARIPQTVPARKAQPVQSSLATANTAQQIEITDEDVPF